MKNELHQPYMKDFLSEYLISGRCRVDLLVTASIFSTLESCEKLMFIFLRASHLEKSQPDVGFLGFGCNMKQNASLNLCWIL